MNKALAIMTLFPYATPLEDFVVRDDYDGRGQYIDQWNLQEPQPTDQELEEAYFQYMKKSQIEVVNQRCNEEITSGFFSFSTGFTFEFEAHDQDNFTQQAILLISDETTATLTWKTKDAGIQTFTREQFFIILKESETHKKNSIGKYWTLKTQIEQATTEEGITAIQWD